MSLTSLLKEISLRMDKQIILLEKIEHNTNMKLESLDKKFDENQPLQPCVFDKNGKCMIKGCVSV